MRTFRYELFCTILTPIRSYISEVGIEEEESEESPLLFPYIGTTLTPYNIDPLKSTLDVQITQILTDLTIHAVLWANRRFVKSSSQTILDWLMVNLMTYVYSSLEKRGFLELFEPTFRSVLGTTLEDVKLMITTCQTGPKSCLKKLDKNASSFFREPELDLSFLFRELLAIMPDPSINSSHLKEREYTFQPGPSDASALLDKLRQEWPKSKQANDLKRLFNVLLEQHATRKELTAILGISSSRVANLVQTGGKMGLIFLDSDSYSPHIYYIPPVYHLIIRTLLNA